MFKVKRIDTGKIYTVLDTYFDDLFHQTYFLIWENDGWRWRAANNFVPPNVESKIDVNKVLEVKTVYGKN